MKPEFTYSIVMATHNAARFLPRAVHSLTSQSYEHWECLVQDAASDDQSQNIVRAANDPRFHLASEPDAGVYDAWNKALARASGEWFLFLGADDALATPHVLAQAARLLQAMPPQVVFVQAGLQVGKNGQVRETLQRSRQDIFRFFVSGMPLLTPAVFFRKTLFEQPDGTRSTTVFDPAYRIAGDFAFVAQQLSAQNVAVLPFVATYMELGGLSSAVKSRPLLDAERMRVLESVVLPRASEVIQACVDTYGDTGFESIPHKLFPHSR